MNLFLLRFLAFASLVAFVACGSGGGGSAPPPAPPVPSQPAVQVLMNTDFEQASPLIWQGDTGVIQPVSGSTPTGVVAHGGTQFAWLGGYGSVASDQLSQDLYIPSVALAATATFWMKIVTAETGSTSKDTVTVSALSTSNAVLATLLTKSNLDAGAYTSYTVDLLPYKGQIVRLSFKSQEDATNATSFVLDDVVAQIVVASPATLKPLLSSFTPGSGNTGEVAVLITGGNFFGVTGVSIGGVSATYVLTDGTKLSATVPATAAIGSAPISITNAQGTGTSATNFSVTTGIPTISRMDPSQGPVGTPVVITGTYLGATTALTLNGQAITPTTVAAGQLTFTVPAGATSGNVVVTTPGGTVNRTFTVNPAVPTLDLHVDKVQLTQSTQTLGNTVPIVAGKAGLIRVFVLANQANTATPAVRITLLNNGLAVAGYPKIVNSPVTLTGVPTALNESALTSSWNLTVPGTELTTPGVSGYSILAEVDPTNAIAEADESNNTTTAALIGTTVPTFKTTIFPVVLTSGTGVISAANKDQWVARLAKMYPVASVDVQVGAAYTASVSTLDAKDADGHWGTLLAELRAKHLAEGTADRYYYGALNVSYASGIAGLGYVPGASTSAFDSRTAIGWDKTLYNDGGNFPEVFAHETGHNMGRQHSPCGGVASSDPNYPYAGGIIGVWGYDSAFNQLKDPTATKDIMGYCTPNWVSDYVYKKILDFRAGTGGFLKVGAEDAPLPKAQAVARECLLVRGIVHEDGRVELLPSFRTKAMPSVAVSGGDFVLEGQNAAGALVFSAALELMEVGCSPNGHERHFVMALPLDATVLDALAGMTVLKGGKMLTSLRSLSAEARLVAPAPELRRLSENQAQLTWDATLHTTVMVRDADSGEVVAILSGGQRSFATAGKRFEVVLSDGVTGRTHQLEIPN